MHGVRENVPLDIPKNFRLIIDKCWELSKFIKNINFIINLKYKNFLLSP